MQVLYASCRRNFTDPFVVGSANLYRDADNKDLTEDEFLESVTGKRVLLLEHGYRSEIVQPWYSQAWSFVKTKVFRRPAPPPVEHPRVMYADVLNGMQKYGVDKHYDCVIGGFWAGGELRADYAVSVWRANKCAKYVEDLCAKVGMVAETLDVQTHSLGAHVALEALRRESILHIRNLFLLAPAVADECIQKDEPYGKAACVETQSTYVWFSRNDPVLRNVFPLGEAMTGHPDVALGWHGAEDASKLPGNVRQFDCSTFIHGHSEYRQSPEFHQLWLMCLKAA
jgi:hypothetical protein